MDKEIKNKKSAWNYIGIIVIIIIILGLFFVFKKGTNDNKTDLNQIELPKIDITNAPMLGDPNAPITIIEYSDFQCPFCRRFYYNALPSIKKEYIETGKVKFVYKDFPLVVHPLAQSAAEAAKCVRKQGGDEAFWKYHDKLFDNQDDISEKNLKKWALDLEYNIDNCLDSGEMKQAVQEDIEEGLANGGGGTPFIVIIKKDGDRVPLAGAHPFSVYEHIIETSL